jgi:hypothetical protein
MVPPLSHKPSPSEPPKMIPELSNVPIVALIEVIPVLPPEMVPELVNSFIVP